MASKLRKMMGVDSRERAAVARAARIQKTGRHLSGQEASPEQRAWAEETLRKVAPRAGGNLNGNVPILFGVGEADVYVDHVCRQPDEECQIGEGFERTRKAIWDILIKPNAVEMEITGFLTHTLLPGYLTPFYSASENYIDPLCVLRTTTIRRSPTNKLKLRAEYNYSTTTRGTSGQVNPLDFPRPPLPSSPDPSGVGAGSGSVTDLNEIMPVLSLTYEDFEETVRVDLSTVPKKIVMKNKRYPDPLPTVKKPILVMNYKRMEPEFKINYWTHFAYTVNNADWNGLAAEKVLCLPWTMDQRTDVGGLWWYPTNYTFKYWDRPEGWKFVLLSMDTLQLVGGNLKEIIPTNGIARQPVTFPWPLDAAGAAITDVSTGTPATEEFWLNERTNFDVLNVVIDFDATAP